MPRHDRTLAVAVLLAQSAFLAIQVCVSDGVHHEDSLSHFLIARSAWTNPANFFDAWGRPGCTAPLALVAWIGPPEIGLMLARLLSALMAGLCALLAWQTARALGLTRPATAVLLLAAQPLFLVLGHATLTEMPCALYLAAAIAFAVRSRVRLSAACLSLAFVTRHECVVLGVVWFAAWIADLRRSRLGVGEVVGAAAVALWAPLLVNLLGWWQSGVLPWTIFLAARPAGGAFYGHGLPTTIGVYWVAAAGPLVVLAAVFGIVRLARVHGGPLVSAVVLAYLGVHTVFFSLNLYASGGYPRFLVAIAVPVALLAAAGLEGPAPRRDAGWTAALLLGWWVLVLLGADLEMGRFPEVNPAASPHWADARWGVRVLLALTVGACLLRRLAGRAGWARFCVRLVLVAAVLAQAAAIGIFVRVPLRRTPHQAQLVAAGRWVAAHHPDAPVLVSSDWALFGLDRPRRTDVPFPWVRFASAPAGTLYLADVSARDWRRAQGAPTPADLDSSSAARRLPLPGVDRDRIALFVKQTE